MGLRFKVRQCVSDYNCKNREPLVGPKLCAYYLCEPSYQCPFIFLSKLNSNGWFNESSSTVLHPTINNSQWHAYRITNHAKDDLCIDIERWHLEHYIEKQWVRKKMDHNTPMVINEIKQNNFGSRIVFHLMGGIIIM